MVSPARKLAFEILRLVEGGGYASDLLHARGASLSSRDAALATELVLGCLRRQSQLDFLIRHFSGKLATRLDAEVRIALRLGIYQIRYLERVPPHAAVAESVELVKRSRKASAAGLVNAVLRKTDRSPVPWPDRATEFCLPPWLWESWRTQFGEQAAAAAALAFLRPPETYIRVPPGREAEAAGLGAAPTDVPGCFLLPGGGAGTFRVQDISSQTIVPLLELEPGMWLLDLCGAPGNKTAQALESGIQVIACDIHPGRLRALAGLDCGRVALDGTRPLPLRQHFERILVDAPCSGTGTLGRNPEIRWRVQLSNLPELHRRQVALLGNALDCLAPGGKMVYSTCSLEQIENEEVVEEVVRRSGARLEVETMVRRMPGRDAGDGFFGAVLTSKKPVSS